MAFKMKNPSIAKMVKMAGNSRSKGPEGKGTKKVDMASPALNEVSGFTEHDGKGKGKAPKDLKSPAKLRKPKRKKDGQKAIDKAREKVGDTARPKGSAMKRNKKFYGDRTRKEMREDQREHRKSLGGDKEEIKANRKYHRGRKKELRGEELIRRGKTERGERKIDRGSSIIEGHREPSKLKQAYYRVKNKIKKK